ncbi:histidine utilization repressor [Pseudomonas typographi]|uniref:Histidine utilization repressor n=1 Tax=Pseudomonas typographi TaxID=2715964 RepID=A0ABR7Z9T3_9PSED|nr:histidine utilization repressor [Pseudomonas typographi]MBD1551863.1 histidine utilization repressor [Pseudomonas typographi]MBD1587667.1 histidine utilization repressor [Pseudomonas typographi]MBD1602305.1 histidine utilization repressor [Pseudomonas typographi]
MPTPPIPSSLAAQMGESPAPLYARVKQMISLQISNGSWPPHYRVPSESELVNELGFSRMTINRALRELTAEGLLVRMQGVGTFVAEPKTQSALFEVHNIADEIRQRGHRHRCQVLELGEAAAGAHLAAAFDIREGSRLYHSVLLHLENDIPVQIEDRYVNPAVAPDYLQQDFTRETPYVYLNRVAPLTEGEHLVEAILAEPHECQWLQIPEAEPCLLIRRRTWSGRHPVTLARLVHPGSRHRLEGRFSR